MRFANRETMGSRDFPATAIHPQLVTPDLPLARLRGVCVANILFAWWCIAGIIDPYILPDSGGAQSVSRRGDLGVQRERAVTPPAELRIEPEKRRRL